MRILVTGAGGFVGRALVPHLLAEGYDVVAASRQPEGVGPSKSFKVEAVGPDTDWSSALEGTDAVVHLAARAHVLKEEAADPLAEHRRVNTEGTRRLAEQAEAAGVKRLVFASSIGVLGNNSLKSKNGSAFTDADEPSPHDDYTRSKWEAELALADFKAIEKVVLRPPLIYGPGVPGNFRRLLGLAHAGKPFPLGGVHNKRSLIGVGNLCSIVSLALSHPKAAGQTYVVADQEQLSTGELYVQMCRLSEVRPRLLTIPEPLLRRTLITLGRSKMAERLCDTLVVDASRLRDELGWRQPVSQAEGLKQTVEEFRMATT